MGKNIYLDYNATTPLRIEVRDAMKEELDIYANASSMHESGRRARARVEEARLEVARLLGTDDDPQRIVFTSGGSESNNTVFSTMFHLGRKGNRKKIIISSIEHPCVLNAAIWLEREGFPVIYLPVDEYGAVDIDAYKKELDEDVLLVSIMMANNEIGTVEDVKTLASLAKARGAFFHTDATQAVGKIPVDVKDLGVDYLTLSAHKLYGPKGVGALYLAKKAPLEPLIRGGHQEDGHRAGTYNNSGIMGFGLAARLALAELPQYAAHTLKLRTILKEGILERIPRVRVNGHPERVLPNTLNVSFPGAEGEAILLHLDIAGIRVSTGSACASGSLEPSHVLMATGVDPELAHGSIRFSLGRYTTIEDIEYVLEVLPKAIASLRAMSTMEV